MTPTFSGRRPRRAWQQKDRLSRRVSILGPRRRSSDADDGGGGNGTYEGSYVVDGSRPAQLGSYRGRVRPGGASVGRRRRGLRRPLGTARIVPVRGPGTADGDVVRAGAEHAVTANAYDERGDPLTFADSGSSCGARRRSRIVSSFRALVRVANARHVRALQTRRRTRRSPRSPRRITRRESVQDSRLVWRVRRRREHRHASVLDALEARTDLIAGRPAWVTVAVKDAPGNVRFVERDLAGGIGTWGCSRTQIDRAPNPRGPRAVIFRGVDAVMDNVTGTHNVSFTPTVAGKIGVSVRVESDGSFCTRTRL